MNVLELIRGLRSLAIEGGMVWVASVLAGYKSRMFETLSLK